MTPHGRDQPTTSDIVLKMFDNWSDLPKLYDAAKVRYAKTQDIKMNRIGDSYAVILVAGMLLESVFDDFGIETVNPHEVVDYFYEKSSNDSRTENYSVRALRIVMDWTISKNMCFRDHNAESTKKSYDFYGWLNVDNAYHDFITSELRKMLIVSGFEPTRLINDWYEDGLIIADNGRKDKKVSKDGKIIRVVRFARSKIDDVLSQ
ncbi:MAG: hypothetical protein JXA38_04055 [Methanosarcinaceae archaeon]|nr:hypothetical protein [Methanosarcinaceae archaeon]